MVVTACCTSHSIPFNPKAEASGRIRQRIREAIEIILEEQLEAALCAQRDERTTQRVGHHNGKLKSMWHPQVALLG